MFEQGLQRLELFVFKAGSTDELDGLQIGKKRQPGFITSIHILQSAPQAWCQQSSIVIKVRSLCSSGRSLKISDRKYKHDIMRDGSLNASPNEKLFACCD